jgi:carboxylate-amine ligase
MDTQTSLTDTAALIALVHCLARDAAETQPDADPPPELIEEAMFRAARFGAHARLPDADGRLRPIAEILHNTLARVEPWAHELGCVQQLALLPQLLRRGGGADRQRAIYEHAGIDDLTKRLTNLTAAAAGSGQRPLDAGLFRQGSMIPR